MPAQMNMENGANGYYLKYLAWIVFLLIAASTAYGIHSSGILTQTIWSDSIFLERFLLSGLCYTVGVIFIYVVARHYLHTALILAAVLLIIASVGSTGLCVASVVLFSALLLGQRVTDFFGEIQKNISYYIFNILLGCGIFSTLVGIAAHFKINYPLVYWFALFVPIALNFSTAAAHLRLLGEKIFRPFVWPEARSFFLIALIAFIILFQLTALLLPEIGADALSMHFAIPGYMAHYARWSFDVSQAVYAVMPLGAEWLYSITYMLGGEFAVKLFCFVFALFTVGLSGVMIRRYCSLPFTLLILAGYLSTPLLYLEAGSLLVENLWVAYLVAAVMAIVGYRETNKIFYFYGTAFFLSLAISIKAPAVFMIIALSPFILWQLCHDQKLSYSEKWRHIILAIGLFAIFGCYQYLYAYMATGNPVFPFFNSFFKSAGFYTQHSFDNALFHYPLGLNILYNITFKSHFFLESLDGSMGLLYFFFLPFVVFLFNSRISYPVVLFFSAAVIFFFGIFKFQTYLRYIYPVLPLCIILIAMALMQVHKISRKLGLILTGCFLIGVFLNIYLMPSAIWQRRNLYVGQSLDFSYHKIIMGLKPDQIFIKILNAKNLADIEKSNEPTVVNFLNNNISFYQGKIFSNSWLNYTFACQLAAQKTPEDVLTFLKAYHAEYIIMPMLDKINFLPCETNTLYRTPEYQIKTDKQTPMQMTPKVFQQFVVEYTQPEFFYADAYLAKIIK